MTPCAASNKTAYAVYAITAFFILAFVYWTDPGMATFILCRYRFYLFWLFSESKAISSLWATALEAFGPLALRVLTDFFN